MADFDRFQEEVINAYHEKKEKHELPPELERPSPTQLMNHCLGLVYKGERTDDLPTLNRIFNPLSNYPDLETGIKKFGADGFRSLQNFMLGKTTKPREPIVKLLAVLIDFQPRPYDKWVRVRSGIVKDIEPEEDVVKNEWPDGHDEPVVRKETIKPSTWAKLKKPVLYGAVAFAGMAGAYQISDRFDHECMYWKTDRYVSVACSEKMEGVEIMPLDNEVIKRFRKIMRPDTITLKSEGKLWYVKPNTDSVEFYTTAGVYPVDKGKKLKPASAYIIRKYVLNKEH